MDKVKIWNDFLEQIHYRVSDVTFNTWFKELHLLAINDREIIISVPHPVNKNHIINNYMDMVNEIFLDITGSMRNITFCLEGEYKAPVPISNLSTSEKIMEDSLDDDKINSYVNSRKTNLNPKYTFDNFVVGDSNRDAFGACLRVAQNPGKLYNPLFMYAKSGLGKTHLMHAIGNYITEHSDLKVLYTTSDDFINEFISVSKDKGDKDENLTYIDLFKNKYRDVDVLMIDEIQFLSSAPKSQQEFTNTFNSLYNSNKQIIICSDRSVNDLNLFADRLKTRFNWGLVTVINVPEFPLKVKIIKQKISSGMFMMDLSDDIIEYIASNCGSDVRILEGSIIRLHAYSAMWGIKKLTLNVAKEALDEDFVNNMLFTDNSISKILNVVANYFKLEVDELKGKKRSKHIAHARMIAMYLCRVLTDESYPRIALELGGRDHTTIIHGYETINKDLKENGELQKIINELKMKMSE